MFPQKFFPDKRHPLLYRPVNRLIEQRRADADDRRPFLDGDLVIAAHAHRKLVQTNTRGTACPQAVPQGPQAGEIAAGLRRRRLPARPCTSGRGSPDARGRAVSAEAARSPRGQSRAWPGPPETFTSNRTGTGGPLAGRGVDGLGQAEAVHRMDHRHQRHGPLDLVSLQVADHVPADRQSGSSAARSQSCCGRLSPRSVQPAATKARISSGPTYFVTATSRTSLGGGRRGRRPRPCGRGLGHVLGDPCPGVIARSSSRTIACGGIGQDQARRMRRASRTSSSGPSMGIISSSSTSSGSRRLSR